MKISTKFTYLLVALLVATVTAQNGNKNGNSNGGGTGTGGGEGTIKVYICHGTASDTNPYNLIHVADDAVAGHIDNPKHNDPTKKKRSDVYIGEELPNGDEVIPDYPGCSFDEGCRVCCGGECIGDPHFQLWNSEWFDFHGQCDLAFLQNPEFAEGLGMDIHVRTTIRDRFSFIESAALKIGEDVLEVAGWGDYILNGVSMGQLPFKMANTYQITHTEDKMKPNVHFFWIELEDGKYIKIQTFKDLVSVKLEGGTSDHFGASRGLMGEFGTGVRFGRDGETVLEDDVQFGQEWQVLETELQLFDSARMPQHPFQCIMPSAKKTESRRLGESIAQAAAEKACSHWGDRQSMCVFDVMATGDLELAQGGHF